MSESFGSWEDADKAARWRAFIFDRDVGIRKRTEYGRVVFDVGIFSIHDAEFVRGEIEVVTPSDAKNLMRGKGDLMQCALVGGMSDDLARGTSTISKLGRS